MCFFYYFVPVTHVTGIACGNGYASKGKYCGIAPKSDIISVKILDKTGQGNSIQAISGLQWILDNYRKYNIKVVNLSIGTNDQNVNLPLLHAVNALWDNGLVVVAAAGNADGRNNSISSPKISPRIITVGSWEDRMLFRQKPFPQYNFWGRILPSQTPPMPDIWAPGEDIISTLSPDYSFEFKNRDALKIVDRYYIKMSGTSMATPMVSGAAALLLEKEPGLTPDAVKKRLQDSASFACTGRNGGLLNIEELLSF